MIFYCRPIVLKSDIARDRAVFEFQLKFTKSVTRDYCWQLLLQFKNPFHLRKGDSYAVWHQGMLVARPGRKFYFLSIFQLIAGRWKSRFL